jgi:uncharacterized protein
MAHGAALYRYPVKGLTPESCDSLTVLPDGRIAGDRVLGLRFADNGAADDEWSPKAGMLVLMNTPGLARLKVSWDESSRRLKAEVDGELLVEDEIHGTGRERIAAAIQEFALGIEPSALQGHPERLPIRLVGDGVTPRFHDTAAGEVTLHGRRSLRALAEALGELELDERRFRSNIAVKGLDPWEELGWAGLVRVGEVTFTAGRQKVRCLATHAGPESGERDLEILTTLTGVFGQEQPTFAVSLKVREPGVIRLGDGVELL